MLSPRASVLAEDGVVVDENSNHRLNLQQVFYMPQGHEGRPLRPAQHRGERLRGGIVHRKSDKYRFLVIGNRELVIDSWFIVLGHESRPLRAAQHTGANVSEGASSIENGYRLSATAH